MYTKVKIIPITRLISPIMDGVQDTMNSYIEWTVFEENDGNTTEVFDKYIPSTSIFSILLNLFINRKNTQ